MNESLTRLHHYGLGSKYNNLGNILTQVRTIIFVLSVWMSHWSPDPLVSGECGVWCQAVLWWCDICDVTRMPRWCQDHIVSNPNCTDLGYSTIHQPQGKAHKSKANQHFQINDIKQLIPIDNMLVWSSLVIPRTTDRLCELLLGSYQ